MRHAIPTCALAALLLAVASAAPARAAALDCPEGSVARGAAPPAGAEAWCEAPSADGTRLVRQGPARAWFASGQVKQEATFVDGAPEGRLTEYHSDGRVALVAHYRAGVLDGAFEQRAANGETLRGSYRDGQRTGLWTATAPGGAVLARGAYVRGERSGPWLVAGADGLRAEGRFVDGRRSGRFVLRSAEGVKRAEGDFRDDRRAGEWIEYDAAGRLLARGTYAEDARHGQWTIYRPGGAVESRGPFVRGVKQGEWTEYEADGGFSVGPYAAGRRHGDWRTYDARGAVRAAGPFVEGQRHGRWTVATDDGRVVPIDFRHGVELRTASGARP